MERIAKACGERSSKKTSRLAFQVANDLLTLKTPQLLGSKRLSYNDVKLPYFSLAPIPGTLQLPRSKVSRGFKPAQESHAPKGGGKSHEQHSSDNANVHQHRGGHRSSGLSKHTATLTGYGKFEKVADIDRAFLLRCAESATQGTMSAFNYSHLAVSAV